MKVRLSHWSSSYFNLYLCHFREDLAKPATNLYMHNLNGILETAIRGTNAQFDDSDILKRLDVRLLEVSNAVGCKKDFTRDCCTDML